jgi:SAM-dependent methyltransferase
MTVARMARAATGDDPLYVNLTSVYAVSRYIQKADEIAARLPVGAEVLDWGCGSGLLAYLLARRGLRVRATDRVLNGWVIARHAGIEPCIAPGNRRLPFADGAFDAVAGSGVLEHVADPHDRLRELHRMLRPGGLLFIYMYPNSLSWVEWLSDRVARRPPGIDAEGGAIGHQRKLPLMDLVALVRGQGFAVERARREDLLPLTGRTLPPHLRRPILDRWRELRALDGMLRSVPLLERLSTNLTIIARRR